MYTHPQEIWSLQECQRRANYAPKDAWGNRQPKGIIASNASTRAQYGQALNYNGGTVIDNQWYAGEYRPLPQIPPEFEFVSLPGWGTIIRRKPI